MSLEILRGLQYTKFIFNDKLKMFYFFPVTVVREKRFRDFEVDQLLWSQQEEIFHIWDLRHAVASYIGI